MSKELLVILGPTVTGKTDLALNLAKKFNGELVAADSRQVYVGLDIGTGKLPSGKWEMEDGKGIKGKGFWEIDGVKIWMYDVVELKTQYTVASYVKDAGKAVDDILSRSKLPIVVGGTGFYIEALTKGLSNLSVPVNPKLRRELEKLSLQELQQELQRLSHIKWESLNESDRKNPRRLLRSIELVSVNPYINTKKQNGLNTNIDILKIGLAAPRQILYKRSNLRVLAWFDQGIIKEVEKLIIDVPLDRIKQLGLEYRDIAENLEGKINEKELITVIQNNLHGYIRRQQTWFKKQENIHWFNVTENGFPKNVEKLVSSWYDEPKYAEKD